MAEKTTAEKTPVPPRTVHEQIMSALKPTGLTVLDCSKVSVLDGDIYNVRVFEKQKG